MFGSAILDVVAGVVFAFLGVSLAASALTEALSSALQWRQNTLLAGVQALLNDQAFTGLAQDLFNHSLVNPLADGTATSVAKLTAKPAYIESANFAMALVDVLRKPPIKPSLVQGAQGEVAERSLSDAVASIPNAQIRQTLQTLLTQSNNEEAAFKAKLANWFDASMARVSGGYKRHTQLVSLCVALAVALMLNIDALHISAALWRQPSLAAALAASVATVTQAPSGNGVATQTPKLASAKQVLDELDKSTLIGWNGVSFSGENPATASGAVSLLSKLLGWAIVAGASLFGAPFWFDTLQRITQLRGVGGGAGVQQRTNERPPA